jgi:hypothetical protein
MAVHDDIIGRYLSMDNARPVHFRQSDADLSSQRHPVKKTAAHGRAGGHPLRQRHAVGPFQEYGLESILLPMLYGPPDTIAVGELGHQYVVFVEEGR